MNKDKLKFVFITACIEEDFFKPVKRGMEDAAKAMDVLCEFTGVEDVDNQAQVQLVKDAIVNKYDGIALNIIDPTAFNQVIDEASAAGIPVVGFNVDSEHPDNHRLSCVCQKFYAAGLSFAKEISPRVKSGGSVLATLHSEGVSALDERLRGIQDGLKEKNLTWIPCITGTSAEKAAAAIAKDLEMDPKISMIFSTGMADTEGAAMVASKLYAQRPLLVAGFDVSPIILKYISEDTIVFSINQQPYIQGFYPVVQLALLCRHGVRPTDIDTGAAFVNKNNIAMIMQACKDGYQ